MKDIRNLEFGGERPLYAQQDLALRNVTIEIGESGLKECRNIVAENCLLKGKYLLWETHNMLIKSCNFTSEARSSLWYSKHCRMQDCQVDAPKMFRRMSDVDIQDTIFNDGKEMFWDCEKICLRNVTIDNCDYIFMHAHDVTIDSYQQYGNYGFQQARNVEIHNAVIHSKDAFWEAENVVVYDSEICGEYLGWYAKNMRLVRCHLSGEQLLCYVDGLVLEDCTFGEDANLLFEYSSVSGSISGNVHSIKNPRSWDVKMRGKCGEWITDDNQQLKQNQAFDTLDEPIERRHSNSVKWDECEDEETLPLWVADMDFAVAPAIQAALRKRIEHPVFGYVHVPDSYHQAVTGWLERRYHWSVEKDWIIYTSGVVPALSAIIRAMSQPGDKVMVCTPAYNCFFSSIRNNGCEVDEVPLARDGERYVFDYEAIEQHAADPRTKILLLCNPHNPVGRVWKRDELQRIGEICLKYNVFVIADEIHCDITMPGHTHIPFASISQELSLKSATCVSPSKAFNIAGLQIANIIVEDDEIRAKIDKAININEVCDVNAIGVEALQAAYNEGEEWLRVLTQYIANNYHYARGFMDAKLPQLHVTELEGTYLMWIDIHSVCEDSARFAEQLKREGKVWLAAGDIYGNAGKGFLRLNLACPRAQLREALERMERFITATRY